MSQIYVCPLSQLDETLAESDASWMLSLLGPGKSPKRPLSVTNGFLALEFNDIGGEREGLIAPNETHVRAIFQFVETWNRQAPLLIHCWMGISRSTAAALIALAWLDRDQDMDLLANNLRSRSPMATPNPLMISIADDLLQLDGRLRRAVASIGRGEDAFEGIPFHMEANL